MRTAAVAAAVAGASATTYMAEKFEDGWQKRWTVGSEWKPAHETGEWVWTGGKYPGAAGDKGLQTSPDARFFSITAPLEKPFDNAGKDLVLSYTVKNEQDLQCGGAYIKLAPAGFDAKKFGGDTPYSIMFGPDRCGYSTKKSHVIFTWNGKNVLTKKNIKMEEDRLSHRYTLIVRPDNTYEVQIDGVKADGGKLEEDFDALAPKTIKDPAAKKPADWVDAAQIDDPTDKKPEGYDDVPEKIPDPDAKKPDDWDDEEDGAWQAPTIPNPAYKGAWSAKKIPNPAYKGPWVHPEIPNPDYDPKAADKLHHVCSPCGAVGFELWQVQAGTLFDDIYVGDSVTEAEAFAKATFDAKKEAEKKAFDALEAEKKAKEEAERKAKEAADKEAKEDDDKEDDKDEL